MCSTCSLNIRGTKGICKFILNISTIWNSGSLRNWFLLTVSPPLSLCTVLFGGSDQTYHHFTRDSCAVFGRRKPAVRPWSTAFTSGPGRKRSPSTRWRCWWARCSTWTRTTWSRVTRNRPRRRARTTSAWTPAAWTASASCFTRRSPRASRPPCSPSPLGQQPSKSQPESSPCCGSETFLCCVCYETDVVKDSCFAFASLLALEKRNTLKAGTDWSKLISVFFFEQLCRREWKHNYFIVLHAPAK